jgi:hypothetical protein
MLWCMPSLYVQHYVIKFVSDFQQVGGFLQVLRFPPPIKLTACSCYNFHLTLWVESVLVTTLYDTFLVAGQWFSSGTQDSSTNKTSHHHVTEILLCNKICQWLPAGRWFSPGTPVSSTNKTDCHDLTEILMKVALNTIT